jgi:hypothetical protein
MIYIFKMKTWESKVTPNKCNYTDVLFNKIISINPNIDLKRY